MRDVQLAVTRGATMQPVALAGVVDAGHLALLYPRADTVGPGFGSVAQFLADPFPAVAHRGGSGDWPEMSLQAYTQALLYGYGAQELSLARTVDGVWFGLHDGYLDRTSLGAPTTTLNASAMTWAQVCTYSILPPTAHPERGSRPYMSLDQYAATYAGSAVTLVDPKLTPSKWWDELFAVMDATGGPDRWIAKGTGPSSTQWASAARARGYATWGYGYEGDVATVATWGAFWSILGMDYTASAAAWAAMRAAISKRVLAHVCPNQAAVNVGRAKGAAGAIVAGTTTTTPT